MNSECPTCGPCRTSMIWVANRYIGSDPAKVYEVYQATCLGCYEKSGLTESEWAAKVRQDYANGRPDAAGLIATPQAT